VSAELDKCYELLGVRPGVSVAELKAAYRDLARVWHPDRFSHDPRLQEKAQEKLKEINEAYELLISGKTPRARAAPPSTQSSAPRARPSHVYSDPFSRDGVSPLHPLRWHWVALPLLLFVLVFVYTTRSLIQRRDERAQADFEQSESNAVQPTAEVSTDARVNVEADSARTKSKAETTPLPAVTPAEIVAVAPTQAAPESLKTVTVTIDPNTGRLARADCPAKTRMSYPSGSEPHGYCTAVHSQATGDPKESKLKSFAKRVAAPDKWLDSNSNKEKTGSNKPNQ
jgi:hypothetical protein